MTGNIRLGRLPASRKWRQVVALIGDGAPGFEAAPWQLDTQLDGRLSLFPPTAAIADRRDDVFSGYPWT